MNEGIVLIILAAGLGKRMGTKLPKVAISTRQMPLITHVLYGISELKCDETIIVTGYQRELVKEIVLNSDISKKLNIKFAVQEQQLGTGDAVKAALGVLKNSSGSVLILCGDTPLISSATLNELIKSHNTNQATVSLISFKSQIPNNYGRIIRETPGGRVKKIVEAKDCDENQLLIEEANSGIYLVDLAFLAPAIKELTNNNSQKEYYLTDILERASAEGQNINAMLLEQANEVLGVNTNYDLHIVNKVLNMKTINKLIDKGVIFELAESCLIDDSVEIASGVIIGAGCQILGKTKIGANSRLEGNAFIKDSIIGSQCLIKFCVRIEETEIAANCSVGPFANLRPLTVLEESSKIGNFVETKKAKLGSGSKANHLTYLGDCTVGKNSNIGAGTITCNYDGYAKYPTNIGSNVFIGSNTALVAPLNIEDGATIGAGSVITKKVEKDSLAFTRPPQVSKAGWSKNKRSKNS